MERNQFITIVVARYGLTSPLSLFTNVLRLLLLLSIIDIVSDCFISIQRDYTQSEWGAKNNKRFKQQRRRRCCERFLCRGCKKRVVRDYYGPRYVPYEKTFTVNRIRRLGRVSRQYVMVKMLSNTRMASNDRHSLIYTILTR